jgi:hypothetical protein
MRCASEPSAAKSHDSRLGETIALSFSSSAEDTGAVIKKGALSRMVCLSVTMRDERVRRAPLAACYYTAAVGCHIQYARGTCMRCVAAAGARARAAVG